MPNTLYGLIRTISKTAGVFAVVGSLSISVLPVDDASGQAFRSRVYSFEAGAAGATVAGSGVPDDETGNAIPSVDDANRTWYDVAYIQGTSSDSQLGCCTGDPVQPWLATTQADAPPLINNNGASFRPSYANVTGDSPAAGGTSTRALEFDASGGFGFGESLFDLGGMRGFIFDQDAVVANETIGNTNFFPSFSYLTQAWLKPVLTPGDRQIAWSLGSEQGALGITSTGKWEVRALGPVGDLSTNIDVDPNVWTHAAIYRNGAEAIFYLNGSVVAQGVNFFNIWPQAVYLGADEQLARPYNGLIDDFTISGFPNGEGIDVLEDLNFFADSGLVFPDPLVLGDVDLDGNVNQSDYDVWSMNFGFNNGFGIGDPGTLILGDADQNGVVNLLDFNVIQREARALGNVISVGAVPEPGTLCLLLSGLGLVATSRRRRASTAGRPGKSSASLFGMLICFLLASFVITTSSANADLVASDDFKYKQNTKTELSGGGFGASTFAGGQNGTAGFWDNEWGTFGSGVIISEGPFASYGPLNLNTETAFTESFFPGDGNGLFRDYTLDGSVAGNQTLYFATKIKVEASGTYDIIEGDPNPDPAVREGPVSALFSIFSDAAGDIDDTAVGFGFTGPAGDGPTTELFAELDGTRVTNNLGNIPVGSFHTVVGKLEVNATGTSSATADFNNDGLANGLDFLIWQQFQGGPGTVAQGDADGNGTVDNADLAIWEQTYGTDGTVTPDERLTVWLNPTGVETSANPVLVTTGDVMTDLFDTSVASVALLFSDPDSGGAPKRPHYYDDIAIGTTWSDVATVSVPRLTLEVNTTDGLVQIINNTSEIIDISAYEILSSSGSLDPNAGGWNSLSDQAEAGWVENNPLDTQLAESNFLANTTKTINPTDIVSLGNAFDTTGSQDIVARWQNLTGFDSLLNLFDVNYVTVSSSISATAAAVPEPSTLVLLALGLAVCPCRRRA